MQAEIKFLKEQIMMRTDKTMKIEMEYIKGDLVKDVFDGMDKRKRE